MERMDAGLRLNLLGEIERVTPSNQKVISKGFIEELV